MFEANPQSAAISDCEPVLDGVRVVLSGAEVGNGAQEPSCGVFVSADEITNMEHLAE